MEEKYDGNSILNLSAASTPEFELGEFMNEIDSEIRKHNYTLTQILPKSEIYKLLTQINSPGNFNSTLFDDIINQVQITSQPNQYTLDAFFQEYVKHYLELRRTRELLVRNSNNLKRELSSYKTKLATSTDPTPSKALQLKLTLIPRVSPLNTDDDYDTIKFKINYSVLKEHLNFINKSECTLSFTSYNEISNGLNVIASKTGSSNEASLPPFIVDKINEEIIKEYVLDKLTFELKGVLSGNTFDFYSTRIFNIENKILNDESILPVLNSKINQLEKIFNKTTPIQNYYNDHQHYGQTPFDQLICYADDIEQYIKGATGQSAINWGVVLYWLDVVMMCLLFVQFLRRFDMIALILGFGVFGLLYNVIRVKYGLYMLVCLIVNLLFEVVWLFYYMTNWGVVIPHEQETGRTLRKWVIVLGWVMFVVQVAMVFVLWKFISEKKYSSIKKGKVNFKEYQTIMSKYKPSIDRQTKPNRFTINYGNDNRGTYDLRHESENDEP